MTMIKEDPQQMEMTEKSIDMLNSLLRGELAAVETYQQAIDKFPTQPEVPVLRRICDEHRDTVRMLSEYVYSLHGIAEVASGPWGKTTHAIQAAANFFGESSALRSLQQGEEIGKAAYETALGEKNLLPEGKNLIRDRLLPRVNLHISTLEDLAAQVTS